MSAGAFRLLVICLVTVVSGAILWKVFQGGTVGEFSEITYSKFLRDLHADQIDTLRVQGRTAKGREKDGKAFRVALPYLDPQLADDIAEHTEATFDTGWEEGDAPEWLFHTAPLLLSTGLLFYVIGMRRRLPGAPT